MRDIKKGYHYKPDEIRKKQLDYFLNECGMSFHNCVHTALDRMYREERSAMCFDLRNLDIPEITRIVQQHLPDATEFQVEQFIGADWAEGVTHQEWLNSANAQEIGDWVASGIE
jgi:hypothetical protein